MNKLQYELADNILTAEDFVRLKVATGFMDRPLEQADKAIKSSFIMDVMNAAQNAEYKKLVVAGEPLNKKEQRELEKQNVNIPEDGE